MEGTVEKWLFYTISCCDIQSVTAYIVGNQSFSGSSFFRVCIREMYIPAYSAQNI